MVTSHSTCSFTTQKAEFDAGFMGSLNPALELWKSSASIRKLPSGHTQSLQTRNVVREIAPDPLLSEWIDEPLRSHAV
jgi:hypothetical protein